MANGVERVAIITGGSRGLGRSIVEGFLQMEGMAVATCSRKRTPFIDEMAAKAEGRFLFAEADLADWEAAKKFVGDVQAAFGQIDILINNAGIAREGLLPVFNDKQIDEVLHINLASLMYLSKLCIRRMMPRRSGTIINISSIVGLTGYRGLTVYSASKAGIDGFTRSLARELGSLGITVNSVAPGYLDTEMTETLAEGQLQQIARRTPLGRIGKSSDVVPLLQFLCSEGAAFITGQTLVVDGGITA